MDKCDTVCHSCNEDNVFSVFDYGDDTITLKFHTNKTGFKFVGFIVRDGNYNFQEVWIPSYEYDEMIKKLLTVRKHLKIYATDKESNRK
jgi:hypothetical protein